MPRISVGILTFNRKEAVLRAIQSALDQGLPDLDIVVVDSASSDGTTDAIRQRFPSVKLISLPRNLGCPGGRNHVYANCLGDYIVNVDDDGYLGDGTLQAVAALFDSDPSIGIVSMRRVYTDEPDPGPPPGSGICDVPTFIGAESALRRSMLDRTGYFPEDFFLFAEEGYLSIRAMDAGYRIVSAPRIIMWHPRIGSSASLQWDYCRFRNSLLVVTRLFPGWLCAKYLVLRLGSYFVLSIKRGTLLQYLRAAAHVLWHLPATLIRRKPCSAAAVNKYFRLRGGTP